MIFYKYCSRHRKDRGNLHSRYQELLQQKKEAETKLLGLQQKQAQILDGVANASRSREIKWPVVSSKFLFDCMDESADRHVTKSI